MELFLIKNIEIVEGMDMENVYSCKKPVIIKPDQNKNQIIIIIIIIIDK